LFYDKITDDDDDDADAAAADDDVHMLMSIVASVGFSARSHSRATVIIIIIRVGFAMKKVFHHCSNPNCRYDDDDDVSHVCVNSEIKPVYRTSVVSYVCVVFNTCLSVGVGLAVWFLYEPPPVAAASILYAIIAGLQLWVVFFANVVLLVAKASSLLCCCTVPWFTQVD